MHLKSLTLRGFKSFAEKTVLDFEPGMTVIVGPNGSGKSNIVDALSWVLGTHSPKSLRGGQMADVIFAGAPGKSALGRSAVEIAIDNSDGTLPVEFSEVTVSRAMFASGENEYAINGTPCRALDVQELLSDTGLGRESHTIVGQGRLDAVLNAKPEERRTLIEEAAGILKHRRRKERALRKLTQMETHVERLTDLLRELRRNLRPLERQAEAARKHAELSRELGDVRRARAVRELARLTERWEVETAEQAASDEHLAELRTAVEAARGDEASCEQALAALTPRVQAATETHFRLANLVERYRGLSERIDERRAGLVDVVEEPVAGRDPEQLRAQAAAERTSLEEVESELAEAEAAVAAAERERGDAEHARRAHEQAAAAESRRRTEARERLLRWEGEISALRSSLAQAAGEEGRLASQVSGLVSRKAELDADREAVNAEIQRLDADSRALSDQLAAAEHEMQRRQDAADEAVRRERELERRRASLEARADALRAASEEATEAASALLNAAEDGAVTGIRGPLADQLRVAEGMARAVAAALGPLGDSLVVTSREAARAAIGFVREHQAGRIVLLVAESDTLAERGTEPDLSHLGARPLADSLDGAPEVIAALRRALGRVYAVSDFDTAAQLAATYPDCMFVAPSGDLAGPRGYVGGPPGTTTAVLSRAAAEQAATEAEEVAAELLVAHRQVGDADRALVAARRELDAATAAMQESDGQLTGAAERLNRLRKELEGCERELATLTGQQQDLEAEIAEQRARLEALEGRGADPVPDEPDGPDVEAERLDDALAAARETEVQARLALAGVEQRRTEVVRRIESLEAEADDVERALVEREERRQARLAAIARCAELADVAVAGLRRAETSLAAAAAERDAAEEERGATQRELGVVRSKLREANDALAQAQQQRHDEELRRAELRRDLDTVRTHLVTELGADPDEALAAARGSGDDTLGGGTERDDELSEAEERLVRKIGLLGTINPLALNEYEELVERERFLSGQLDDLRTSRQDLTEVITAVDDKIREVFGEAFADVAIQFERIFPLLFPGGEGRLVLTDPEDLLDTGVEVEARPPGKRVKRLSLLSGGERSLTALAVLFAIFAARPSPFYVLDEVEAALDDVNLQRFLDLLDEFKGTSQLLVVTHQRRTMEAADVLYGVTMHASAVSKVISQRLTDSAVASG